MNIDSSASIHPSAKIHPNCFIGPNVVVGADCEIGPNAIIVQDTILGKGNRIHPNAVVGGDSQHKEYSGESTQLIIGDYNVIRECVTLNRGDPVGGSVTRIGNNNLFMAYSHVAHDCTVGDHVIVVNHSNLAGHVIVEDHVVIGAYVGVTQFCKVGCHSFITEAAFVSKDILPFCNVGGQPSRIRGINVEGLKRKGLSTEEMHQIKSAYREIFKISEQPAIPGKFSDIMKAFHENSERGLMQPKSLRPLVV